VIARKVVPANNQIFKLSRKKFFSDEAAKASTSAASSQSNQVMVSFIINCIMCVFHVLCIEGSFFTRILALPVLFFQKLVLYLYKG
jgi:hypothetical protein